MTSSRILGGALLALAIALPASAQRPTPPVDAAAPVTADIAAATATFQRSFGSSSVGTRNRTMLEEALREFGFTPSRLRRADVAAIDDALSTLVPGADRQRHGLNRMQARAVVYMALVYPRGAGGDAWNDAWDGGPRVTAPRPRERQACVDMEVRAYDLENAVAGTDARGAGLFLNAEERRRATTLTREVQSLALNCGARDVADRGSDLLRLLGENLPNRSTVHRRIADIKDAIRQVRR